MVGARSRSAALKTRSVQLACDFFNCFTLCFFNGSFHSFFLHLFHAFFLQFNCFAPQAVPVRRRHAARSGFEEASSELTPNLQTPNPQHASCIRFTDPQHYNLKPLTKRQAFGSDIVDMQAQAPERVFVALAEGKIMARTPTFSINTAFVF